jgi:hypothetical protein
MSDEFTELIDEVIRGRNSFLISSNIRAVPYTERSRLIHHFLDNERLYIEFINRLHTRTLMSETAHAASALLSFSMPANYMEPVVVVATANQINSSLVSVAHVTSGCAICQDSITSDGCRIRQCRHSFHRSCILNWFASSVRCPVCRHDIREENPAAGTSPVGGQTPSQ